MSSLLFISGLALLFAIERYFQGLSATNWMRALAGVMITGGLLLDVAAWKGWWRGNAKAAAGRGWQVAWKSMLVSAVITWALWQMVPKGPGSPLDGHLWRVLLGLWLVLVITGLSAGSAVEWTVRRTSGSSDASRITKAWQAGLATGMLLCSLVALNYAAVRRDVTRDWSYLKVTAPSEATVNVVRASSLPVTLALFFQRENEVLPYVESYAQQLAAMANSGGEKISVQVIDKDMDPAAAAKFKTSRPGVVIAESGTRTERIDLGPTLTAARPVLKKLDSEVQRILMSLTSKEKNAYVMRGHGELGPDVDANGSPLTSSRLFEGFLRDLNWNIKTFGLAEGSATKVPDDAALVMILGPREPVMKEEVEALKEYTGRGGSLFIALDTEGRQDALNAWLASIGIEFDPLPVANDGKHVAATRSPADKWILFTTSFGSHESTRTLSRNDDKVALLTFASGSFSVTPEVSGWRNTVTVRSLTDSFVDRNRNYTFDEKSEKRGSVAIGVASSNAGGKDGKIVLVADSGVFSDALIRNPGNITYAADAIKWLAGEQALAGKMADEEDVKIRHTGKQDLIWFYGSIIAVPASVLLAGAATIRGSRKRRRRDSRS